MKMPIDLTLDTIKNISLYQKKQGYRFTIDSLLLADFVRRTKPFQIVDLGSGNGIIGILLARKYPGSKITLVEIQSDLFNLCRNNIELNGLSDRVAAYNFDMKYVHEAGVLSTQSFDTIVTNPPFRVPKTGRISPYEEKAIARHEISLNLNELMQVIDYLLKPKGYMYMIYNPDRIIEVFEKMRRFSIEPKRIRFVHPDSESESRIVLIEGIKAARPSVRIERPLFIYTTESKYTEEVSFILKSF